MATRWSLESLTVGPLSCETDADFWHDAFRDFPTVPRLKEVTIIYYYQNIDSFDLRCWAYFNTHFCRKDLFPQSMRVEIQVTIESARLGSWQESDLALTLLPLRRCQLVTFWGSVYGMRLFVCMCLFVIDESQPKALCECKHRGPPLHTFITLYYPRSFRYRAFKCLVHTRFKPHQMSIPRGPPVHLFEIKVGFWPILQTKPE